MESRNKIRDYEELEKLYKPAYEDVFLFKTNEISRMLIIEGEMKLVK